MNVTSSAIQPNGQLLPQYTCDGENHNPPLTLSEVPVEAKSLTLIVEDPDAPGGTFTHWLLYDMSPATMQIPDGAPPMTGTAGTNDFGQVGYGGPCPPSGTHRYYFRLYALDTTLGLPEGASKKQVQIALEGHIIDTAELVGTYTRRT